MKNPFRFWMTGGAAMMLAALSGGVKAISSEERHSLTRISRFDMDETVSRIAASAQRHGLPVLARLRPPAQVDEWDDARLVIVLESSEGGTPVSMTAANAPPDLLLSLVVQRNARGATEVQWLQEAPDDWPEGMPDSVRHELADLPFLVDEALAA